LLGVLLDVPAAVVGEAERAPAAGLLGLDQALVGELLQGRVDRAGAGPPGAAAALLDLGHDLVPVARAFAQQRPDRGAHAAAAAGAALGPRRRAGGPGPPAPPVPAEVARPPRAAGSPRAPGSPWAGWPLPGALRPSEPALPRPAAPARTVPAAHPADGALDLAQHAGHRTEYLEEAGVEVPRPSNPHRHPPPPPPPPPPPTPLISPAQPAPPPPTTHAH